MTNALTPEQEALLPVWRDKWTQIGTSTEPADRPTAELAILTIYSEAGLAPPEFVWCDSPKAALETSARDRTGDSVWKTVWLGVEAPVWANVRSSVLASVWSSVVDSVLARVSSSISASICSSVHTSIRGNTWNLVFHGQHQAGWVADYDYYEKVLGIQWKGKGLMFPLWRDLAMSCNWWVPYEKVCFVCDRPIITKLEPDRKLLHSQEGPAIQYRDQWWPFSPRYVNP